MRYLNLNDFGRIIQEAISKTMNEAMPPKPIGVPKPIGAPNPIGAPKPIGAPSPINNIPQNAPLIQGTPDTSKPFKGGPTKNGIRVGVADAKYEKFFETSDPNETDKEVFKIWLDYVSDTQAQRWINLLNQKFGNVVFADKILKPKSEKSSGFSYFIKLIARPGKTKEFVSEIPNIIDSLYTFPTVKNRMTGFSVSYDDTFKDELIKRMQDFVDKSVSEDEIQQVNIKIADNWLSLLSDLKNPATMKKLGGISGIVYSTASNKYNTEINGENVKGDNGKAAGHQLSFRNKAEIFAQDPNATFVTQAFVWEKIFNHEVIDPNKYILVTVPTNNKNVTKADRDAASKKAGYQGGYDEFKTLKKRGEVSGGEEHAVRMNANIHANGTPMFKAVKMYDVANTRPIPGLESKFFAGPNQEKNLENNILGIPNAAAKSAVSTVSAPIPTTDNSSSNENIDIIRDSLMAVVMHEIGTVPQSTGNAERDVVNYAYAYAKFLLKTAFQGISKPETQEAFCQGFTAAVAYSLNIEDAQAANYLQNAINNRGKDSTIKQLIVQWHNEYVELLDAVTKDVYKKMKQIKTPVKKVVEEEIVENGITVPEIKIMPLDKFEEMFGVDDEQIYEEQEDIIDNNVLKESFFAFLDKMDPYGK